MTDDAGLAMKARLRADLKVVMKARDAAAVRALRSLIAALDNAEAVPAVPVADEGPTEVARLQLDPARIDALIAAEAAERDAAAAELDRVGQAAAAEAVRAEAEVVRRYLG